MTLSKKTDTFFRSRHVKGEGVNYHDAWLVPESTSECLSRQDIVPQTTLSDRAYSTPFCNSPMVDVVGQSNVKELQKGGGPVFYHRFEPLENIIRCLKNRQSPNHHPVIPSVGISKEDEYKVSEYLRNGFDVICVDVANADNINVIDFIARVSDYYPNVKLVVGNIASAYSINRLCEVENVVGIRVSVASGSPCTTKLATGILSPTLSIIYECSQVVKNRHLSIIADGGVSSPGDACKAIAAGANFVMMGKTFAACTDSPARYISGESKIKKLYRGSASHEIQALYREKVRHVEGAGTTISVTGTTKDVTKEYVEGLQSCMSYFNSRNLDDFRDNVNWVSFST